MAVPLPSSSAQQMRQSLGLRLREIRIHTGLTARDLGRLMGRHGSKISRIEHGTVTPSAADIRTWCTHCGAPDEAADLVASALVVDGMFVEWHRIERTGLRQEQEAILPIFDRTQRFRAYSSWLVPGMLQTSAYTRAVLEVVTRQRGLPDDIDDAIASRRDRQRILHQGDHRFAVLIEESVLRGGVASAEVMVSQLGHLIAVSALPRVSLGIVPMRADRCAWPVEDFWVFDDARVNVELVSGCLTITQPREVAMYMNMFGELAGQSVYGAAARALIASAIEALDAGTLDEGIGTR